MPQLQQLTEEQVQQSFRRAQELVHQTVVPTATLDTHTESGGTDLESYLKAAEELGIPREAAVQALREQMLLPVEEVSVGDAVFAPSVDGHHYPATVTKVNGNAVVVRFAKGGEHTVAAVSLHPMTLVPGREIEYEEKDWGWVRATIKAYDTVKKKVEVSTMWETKKVSLDKLRLAQPKKPKSERELKVRQLLWRTAVFAGGTGALIGWLIGHIFR